jgi:membrane-associated protease RseP (regulator of RpoE activity)
MDYLARVRQDGLRVEMVSPPQRWCALRGERIVAEISDTPAFLAPSGAGALADLPVDRQFLSLVNPSPEDWDDLRRMLSQSGDLTAFLRGLTEAGYRVTALDR